MSHQPYHNVPSLDEQQQALLEHGWHEVVNLLPAQTCAQAYQLGAFEREREFASPTDVLRGLLAYVLGPMSFRQVGAWAVLIGLANISDTAWRKRLRKAHAWMFWLLSHLLAPPPSQCPPLVLPPHLRRVLLIDATRLKRLGGTGDDWRLHLAYDLAAARFAQVSISDQHGAESLSRFVLHPGDVVVADMGYGYRKCVADALSRQAHALVRISANAFPLLTHSGQSMKVVEWLKQKGPRIRSRRVCFDHEGQRFQVRLLAKQLDAQAAERARQAKKKEASKKQYVLSEDALYLAGWVLLICTVPKKWWTDAEVVQMYQARWQIELVFKRMKQLLHLNQLRGTTVQTNEACIVALLLAWVLQEQEASHCRAILETLLVPEATSEEPDEDRPPAGVLSQWVLTAIEVQTVRTLVQGYWTCERVRQCLPCLHRFVYGSPRTRRNQLSTVRRWLNTSLSQQDVSPLVFTSSSA